MVARGSVPAQVGFDFLHLGEGGAERLGLVLGGGGARGFAHIGVIQAFHDAGIPIDSIGGTSSGAMCSVMYATDLDPHRLAVDDSAVGQVDGVGAG